ncbi:MAG: GNAT family N-acetyltransferase [Acidimicrobiia bacterium]|jgi:ElaA protein|nr:GNAT family N-acetyltransferase [Acidimicrobiia bacterium]
MPQAPVLHDASFAVLDGRQVHDLLALRSQVFVIEQACVYLDPDGRDTEPGARHLWFEGEGRQVLACARILDDGDARRIGRIATHPDHRGQGLAGRLIERFLATTEGPWVMEAQAHLAGWYARWGFERAGPDYIEDGIAHTPLHRKP